MQPPVDRICCPYCAVTLSAKATLCTTCGKELHAGLYWIVPDGSDFGIAFDGEIKIHGLSLERAQRILAIMNQYFPE